MAVFSTLRFWAVLALSAGLLSCDQNAATTTTEAPAPPKPETLRQAADNVRRYLVNLQMDSLRRYTPEGSAILFAPYGFIHEPSSQKLTTRQLATLVQSREKLVWGTYDGIGGDISLDVPAYFAKFVNDKDYANADSVKVNQVVRIGNKPSNIETAFPGAEYVEYFRSGTEKYAGLDFGQLRLVFKRTATGYRLVGVVHNQSST